MAHPVRFGLDRLLQEPELRRPLAGRRVALLAHPASVTRDLTHSLDALAALPDLDAVGRLRSPARPARRQAGQHGGVARLHRPAARHPGVQPVRRGTPPDRGDDGHLRRAAGRPAGPRLPHLHLHHHAALRAGRGGATRQGGVGARPPQPRRPPGRGHAVARRLGELRRRRPPADAPRHDHGRARALVRRHARARRRNARDRDAGLAVRKPPPATAGRSASAPGSTPAPTRPTCGWRVPTPAP